jgi:hypothetical protein
MYSGRISPSTPLSGTLNTLLAVLVWMSQPKRKALNRFIAREVWP